MTIEERKSKISEAYEMSYKIKNILREIVWENQEGQKDHFDNLPKVEQVALIGIFNDASCLESAIDSYKHWFINK